MSSVRVVVDVEQAHALQRGLRRSHRALIEDVAHALAEVRLRAAGPGRLQRTRRQLAAVVTLLAQLAPAEWIPPRSARLVVAGEREPLRDAACDAFVGAVDALAVAAAGYWNHDRGLAALELGVMTVARRVELLRALERAPPLPD